MGSTKKQILIFSDWFLPGYKAGGPIRSLANLVKHLNKDFNIFLVCGDRDYLDTEAYAGIQVNTWIESYGIKLIYLHPKNQEINTCGAIIDRINPDVVYINGVFSKAFSINPLLALKGSKRKIIVAPRGMLAKGALSIKPFKKMVYLLFARLSGIFSNVTFHATSKQEKSDISRYFPRNNFVIVPNLSSSGSEKKSKKRKKNQDEINIVSVARIAPEKNIEFALECLKQIQSDIQVKMIFIGSVYDQKYFEKCRQRAATLKERFEISFLGHKNPEEIDSYYKSAHLFFLPTLGENYGHAIVEAIHHNLPVLISDNTPWKNLDEENLGADYPLTDISAFSAYIEKIAHMSETDYNSYTKGIASRFSRRIDLKGNLSSYKELFDA